MPWSTRELAELAGTTVNTIRHYHRMGLLDKPERRSNGYKQYEMQHLVNLLRIRRLVDVGVPLSQMHELSTGAEGASEMLYDLDAELQMSIERLQGMRADIVEILRHRAPARGPEP